MWDAIKKAASNMMDTGASLMRHGLAIEQILASPTVEIGWYNFRAYIYGIDDATEFERFKQAATNQLFCTQQALVQAQSGAYDSWGVTTEDRQYYLAAHIDAGLPAGVTGQTQMLHQRLQALAFMLQTCDQVWAEAQQAKAQGAPSPPGPTPT